MSLKANVITIFSPQLTTDQQPQAPNTQSSFINQIIHPSSLFHTTIFILQLLFLPSVSPPAIAFVDLWPLPPFPLLFRQYSTPEAETNLILKLWSSSSRINQAAIHVENKGERRGTIGATFSIEICHLSPLHHIDSNSQSHNWNDCISSWYPSTKEGVFITAILWRVVVHSTTFIGKRDVDEQKRWVDCC